MMGKPSVEVYEKFRKKYFDLCREAGLEQYIVPYLMSSHPGATMKDAVEMALWLKKWNYSPEQVQDFYPTPGTISTVMYYTGIHPLTKKKVPVTTDYREKQLQRALLQYKKPENANLVREALTLAGREDLIGNSPECLVRPAFSGKPKGGKRSYSKDKRQDSKKSSRSKSSSRHPSPAARSAQSSPRSKKTDKLSRIFGEDAKRIKLEAEKVAKGAKKGSRGGKKPH